MPQLCDHDEVFPPGQNLIYGSKLAGQADGLPHLAGFLHHVKAVDGGGAAVRFEQRGENFNDRRLARAVRAEQGKNLAVLYLKIDAL